MNLKVFILSFAPFLVVSLGIFAAIKQVSRKFAAFGKKPAIYGLVIAILSAAIAFSVNYSTSDLFLIFWMMALIYLLFGLIHFRFTHKRYFVSELEPANRQMAAAIMYAFAIVLFAVVIFALFQFFIVQQPYLYYPVLFSMLFFIIPLLVFYTTEQVLAIPSATFSSWQYPLDKTIDLPDEREGERLYVIGFEIAKKGTDAQRTYFRAKAPEDMILGELFYHFINDYNELQSETPIQYTDQNGKAYEWLFRSKPKFFKPSKVLDSTKGIHETGIRENTVIICERKPL